MGKKEKKLIIVNELAAKVCIFACAPPDVASVPLLENDRARLAGAAGACSVVVAPAAFECWFIS